MDGANSLFNNSSADSDIRSRMRGFEPRPTVYQRRSSSQPAPINDISLATRQSIKVASGPVPTIERVQPEPLLPAPHPMFVSEPAPDNTADDSAAAYPMEFNLTTGATAMEAIHTNPFESLNANLSSLGYMLDDLKEIVVDRLYDLKKLRFKPVPLPAVAVAAALVVMALIANAFLSAHKQPQPNGFKTVQYSAATAPVSMQAVNDYSTPADQPRLIDITYLGVHARVKSMSLSDGQLQTAFNINDTAWYNTSAKPGDAGTTVITGPVADGSAKGVFYNLSNLRVGDIIQITRGDSQAVKYQVMKSSTYDTQVPTVQAAEQPVDVARSCLNLVAIVGQNTPSAPGLNQRVIVYTEQIN